MSENTKIEWADHSWSPWRGCTKVSPGCANCYAETLSKRNPAVLGEWGKAKPRVLAKNWNDPVKWHTRAVMPVCPNGCGAPVNIGSDGREECPRCDVDCIYLRPRVFPSLCDWLDDEVPVEWLARFLRLIHATPHLDWLLLTKRPQNWTPRIHQVIATHGDRSLAIAWMNGTPPPNVWLGVSVEDHTLANDRIPLLLQIPARLRWLSVEPLLGPVDLEMLNDGSWWDKEGANKYDALRGIAYWLQHGQYDHGLGGGPKLDWFVIGGESGHGARPCNVDWIRSLVAQGQKSGVPVFVKQLGGMPVDRSDRGFEGDSGVRGWPMGTDVVDDVEPGVYQGKPVRVRLRHRKGGDPSEWPEILRVREFPKQKGQP